MAVFMRGPGCLGGELASAGTATAAPTETATTATATRRSTIHDTKARSPCASPSPSDAPRPRLVGGLRGNQPPIRIARGDLARERPDIRHFLDALGVARDHYAPSVAGGGDQLAHELDGDLGYAVLQLGLDDVRSLDAHEALVDLLAATLAIADGTGKAVVNLTAQQALEGLAVALGEGRDDDLVGPARALQEGVGVEGCIGANDLHEAFSHTGVAGSE